MFSPLRALLGRSVARAGIQASVTAARARRALLDLVETRWGKDARTRVTGVTLTGGRLIVSVDTPSFAQEFVSLRTTLIDDLNARLGSVIVHDLHVRVRRRSATESFTAP